MARAIIFQKKAIKLSNSSKWGDTPEAPPLPAPFTISVTGIQLQRNKGATRRAKGHHRDGLRRPLKRLKVHVWNGRGTPLGSLKGRYSKRHNWKNWRGAVGGAEKYHQED